jgi:hypothetical protein
VSGTRSGLKKGSVNVVEVVDMEHFSLRISTILCKSAVHFVNGLFEK